MDGMITVGIPFYNAAEFLADAIRSVVAQTYTDWELILVNDGSTDDSLRIAQTVAMHDDRIRVIDHAGRRGLATRLNQIADLSQTEYLARMDADDLMHPERLSKQLDYFMTNPDVDILGTGLYSIDSNATIISTHYYDITDNILKSLFDHQMIMHPTIMGRTRWFQRHRYDEKRLRTEDQELWARTYHMTNFANIQEPLLFYRMLTSPERLRERLAIYILSFQEERQLFRQYGPQVSYRHTVLWIVKSYIKELSYRAAARLGRQNELRRLFTRARFQKLTPQHRQSAQSTLEHIMRTQLSGLESCSEPSD